MAVEIKFCGLTRAADVEAAVAVGAHYVGVVFALGRRTVSVERARELLRAVPRGVVQRVGVFGPDLEPLDVAAIARAVGLDVVQLHGDPDGAAVEAVRAGFPGPVWAAVRVRGDSLPVGASDVFRTADATVLDAHSAAALGGTGAALPWAELVEPIAQVGRPARLVLAGGLRPGTVSTAIRVLQPDVVDVSSGVESAPGIKDHAKLRAFRDAVEREAERR